MSIYRQTTDQPAVASRTSIAIDPVFASTISVTGTLRRRHVQIRVRLRLGALLLLWGGCGLVGVLGAVGLTASDPGGGKGAMFLGSLGLVAVLITGLLLLGTREPSGGFTIEADGRQITRDTGLGRRMPEAVVSLPATGVLEVVSPDELRAADPVHAVVLLPRAGEPAATILDHLSKREAQVLAAQIAEALGWSVEGGAPS